MPWIIRLGITAGGTCNMRKPINTATPMEIETGTRMRNRAKETMRMVRETIALIRPWTRRR